MSAPKGYADEVLVGRVWQTSGMSSSIRTDWATPVTLFSMLDREFHFQLDACATEITTTCPAWFGSDALARIWAPVTWCNPPYVRLIGDWIEKGYRESQHGNTVVMLLPARTDTQWFHDYCMRAEIRFLRGRLCFDDRPNRVGRCPFPSMIVVFRAVVRADDTASTRVRFESQNTAQLPQVNPKKEFS
jgi:phage N-6-adenine-methyltransferase